MGMLTHGRPQHCPAQGESPFQPLGSFLSSPSLPPAQPCAVLSRERSLVLLDREDGPHSLAWIPHEGSERVTMFCAASTDPVQSPECARRNISLSET